MNPRVRSVKAHDDHSLTLTFTNGETRRFDMKPYLDKGVFRELRDLPYFKQARPALGTVQWPHEQDLCPDTFYEDSLPISGRAGKRRRVPRRSARAATRAVIRRRRATTSQRLLQT